MLRSRQLELLPTRKSPPTGHRQATLTHRGRDRRGTLMQDTPTRSEAAGSVGERTRNGQTVGSTSSVSISWPAGPGLPPYGRSRLRRRPERLVPAARHTGSADRSYSTSRTAWVLPSRGKNPEIHGLAGQESSSRGKNSAIRGPARRELPLSGKPAGYASGCEHRGRGAADQEPRTACSLTRQTPRSQRPAPGVCAR